MSDVYLGCVKCMETVLIGDAPNSIRHMIGTNPDQVVYGKLVTKPEVLKDLEHFLYSHMGHDLRFADLDSFKQILQSKLENPTAGPIENLRRNAQVKCTAMNTSHASSWLGATATNIRKITSQDTSKPANGRERPARKTDSVRTIQSGI